MQRLALGTVQFGLPYGIANQAGQVTRPEVKVMLELAAASAIDTLDTAIAYGESEACLGAVGLQGFKVITKLTSVPDYCDDVSDWVKEQVALSLARLGVSELYGLLLHRSENLLDANGKILYRTLQDLKESGQIRNVGISIYSPHELESITEQFHLDLVQAPFNLVDHRLHATGWLQRLKDKGVEIHTRSAFLQGLLLMREAAIPPKFARWSNIWESWHKWLADHDVSSVQACLAFPLSFPEIDRVVVGADSANQLLQIIGAATSALQVDLPNLCCNSEDLINPSCWTNL